MKNKKLKKAFQYEIFLLPAFLAFTLFTIIPLVKTIMYSVTDFNGISHDYNFVGLKNFIGVFQDEMMRHSLFNTIFYTFCTMILINLLAIPLAVFLDRNTKLKSVERAVFFFPSIVSGLLLGYVWGYILSPMKTGALNSLLSIFDIGPIGFTATEWGAKSALFLLQYGPAQAGMQQFILHICRQFQTNIMKRQQLMAQAVGSSLRKLHSRYLHRGLL